MNGEISVSDILQWVAFISTVGGIYRFVIKPLFQEREEVRRWRRNTETRLTMLEAQQDPAHASLRKSLLED